MSEAIDRLNNIHKLPAALESIELTGPNPQRNIVRLICESNAIAMESGKQSEMERKEILNDGTDRRPADVYIHNFAMIQAQAVDVAVVDGAAVNSIKNKEIEKRRKYLVDCANNDLLFSPFVLDSFNRIGRWVCIENSEEVVVYIRGDS
jgi:hypothetical protein